MGLWYETGNGPVKISFAKKRNNCVAFLCGGGPSLKNVDPSILNGHNRLVFALNNTYPFVRPDIWIGMDDPECYRRDIFWQPFIKIMRGGYQDRLSEGHRIDDLHNVYYADLAPLSDPEDIFKLRAHDIEFAWKQNVLVTALHIIIWMGIKKIYLFGCDLNNGNQNYYENIDLTEEQKEWNSALYSQQLEYLKWFAETGKKYNL